MRERRNRLIATLLIVFATSSGAYSQFAADARSRGLGCIISFPGDPFAACNNPAWMACADQVSIGISVQDKYLLKEMKEMNLAVCYGLNLDALGLSISVAGIQPYLKQHYSVSYSKKFGERIHSGLGFDYLHFNSTEATQAVFSATFRAGLGVQITEKLYFSFCGLNPLGLSISTKNSSITPRCYVVGLAYLPSRGLQIAAEMESSSTRGTTVKAGLDYLFGSKFALRAGCLSNPFRVTFGTGLHYDKISIDLASEYHSYLGFSPSLSVSYSFDKHTDDEE